MRRTTIATHATPTTGTSKSRTSKNGNGKKTKDTTGHALRDFIVKCLDDNKAEEIISIDLSGKTVIADHMVIASGRSSRQVAGLAKNLDAQLAEYGVSAKIEGQQTGDWVVVDAGDVIVHIFRPEVRDFYGLEKLWATDFATVGYNLYTTK